MIQLFILLNILLIEILLSIDNAAVLAVMIKDLPPKQQSKALKYGIVGAYALRGACLLLASYLVKILFLKILGGLYLCWLSYSFFFSNKDEAEEEIKKNDNFIFKYFKNAFGVFWTTVIMVEFMDLSFSLDNIFAVVAFTDNIYLICAGVFIGILAMRFVAQKFVKILEKFPALEKTTFIVIALLGIKLSLSGILDYMPGNSISPILNNHTTDVVFSMGILLMFITPILYKKLTN